MAAPIKRKSQDPRKAGGRRCGPRRVKNKVVSVWRNAHASFPYGSHAMVTTLTNLLLAALGILSGVAAARLLGPAGRGELAAIQTVPGFVGTLAMIGIPEAVVYYSARQPGNAGTYLGSGIALALAASIPFMLVAYALMPWILSAQRPAAISAARWYLWIVVLYATVGMLLQPLRGRNDFLSWNALRLLVPISWLSVLALAWVMNRRAAPFVASANIVATFLLAFPFSLIVFWRIPGPYYPSSRHFGEMTAYGLPCMLTGVPQMLNLRLDQMLMAALLPPRELGLYAVAVAWSAAPAPLLSALGAVTTPAVASAASLADGSIRLAATLRTAIVLALTLGFTLTLCTPIAIVILFGPRFAAAAPAAMVLVPAAAVLGLNLVLQEGLRGMGRPYAVLQAELAASLSRPLSSRRHCGLWVSWARR